jgi:hypothetical protein
MKKKKPTYKQYFKYLNTADLTTDERKSLTEYLKHAKVGSYVSTLYWYAAIGSKSLLPKFLAAVATVWGKQLAEVEVSYRRQAAKSEASSQKVLATYFKEIASLYKV